MDLVTFMVFHLPKFEVAFSKVDPVNTNSCQLYSPISTIFSG